MSQNSYGQKADLHAAALPNPEPGLRRAALASPEQTVQLRVLQQQDRFAVADFARLNHRERTRERQLRDLSERKRLESELFQARKLEAIGRLSGGIAHDFNNLLTVITASADIARTTLAPKHPACLELDGIQEAAARAAQLTAQLLAFVRTYPVRQTAFDLNHLITGMSAMLQRVLREDVRLSIELSLTPVAVFADRGQIEQVVLNLVLNARDAMPSGGPLTIRTKQAAADAAQVDSVRPGVIEVSDHGHGIDLAVKERIFEPFVVTKPAGTGTGLGLSSSHGIVSSAGGRIDVDSAPGRGATFRIVLPGAARLASEPAAAAAARGVSAGRGQRILLVEDQAPLRAIAARGLRMDGYEVVAADNGISALALLETLAIVPDLLVADIVMPGMDGSELARRLQRLRPALPILFISGYDQQGLTDEPGPAPSLLYKPFNISTLCARVHEMLEATYYPVRATG